MTEQIKNFAILVLLETHTDKFWLCTKFLFFNPLFHSVKNLHPRLSVIRLDRNLRFSPTTMMLLTRASSSFLISSSMLTGAMFSPPAVMMISWDDIRAGIVQWNETYRLKNKCFEQKIAEKDNNLSIEVHFFYFSDIFCWKHLFSSGFWISSYTFKHVAALQHPPLIRPTME